MITLKKKSLTDFEAAISLPQGDFDLELVLSSIEWDKGDPSVGVKPSISVIIESVKCTDEKIVITDDDAPEEVEKNKLYNFMLTLDWEKAVNSQKLECDDLHETLENAIWDLNQAVCEELEKEF